MIKRRWNGWAVVGLAVFAVASAQADEECGTKLTAVDVAAALRREAAGAYQLPQGMIAGAPYSVPLTFHVVRRTNGTGGLPQARLDQAVIDANLAYANAGITFCQHGPTIFIDSDAFYFNINTMAEINALRTTNPVPDTINIYFTENLAYEGGGLCGISAFTTSPVQGIAMANTCTATTTNHSTFPHEIGHYFDLYHTHETSFGNECVNGSNCATAGDRICDTPADPTLLTGVTQACIYTLGELGPCAGDGVYVPDVQNFMNYAPKHCRIHFSPQQNAKALATLLNLRPELVDGCAAPVAGDVNGDGVVDVNDLLLVVGAWGPCPTPCLPDLNGDQVVNVNDLLLIIGNWT